MADGLGVCTWPYALVGGVRRHIREAARHERGICPVCGAELVARKGLVREDHWWHINGRRCDPWYQPKGLWHLYWQNKFPSENQEVVVTKEVGGKIIRHIADVRTEKSVVLEVQWSPLSLEAIAEREAFYGNMLWLAGMQRTEGDHAFLHAIVHGNIPISIGTEQAWVVEDRGRISQQKWCYATKPVVFDFAGTKDLPESEEPLYCLLPKVDDGEERICIEIARERLMAALRTGKAGILFRYWKESISAIINRWRNAKSQKTLLEEAKSKERQEREREQLLKWEEENRQWRERCERNRELEIARFKEVGVPREDAESFVAGRFDQTFKAALSLGWVESYLVCKRYVFDEVGLPMPVFLLPKMGRLVLHYVNGYAYEAFKHDVEIARQLFGTELSKTLDFEKMRRQEGKVVAAIDYYRYEEKGKIGVILRNGRMLKRARKFDLVRSEIGFSKISEKQAAYFALYDVPFA